jgi:hypothetical protein
VQNIDEIWRGKIVGRLTRKKKCIVMTSESKRTMK